MGDHLVQTPVEALEQMEQALVEHLDQLVQAPVVQQALDRQVQAPVDQQALDHLAPDHLVQTPVEALEQMEQAPVEALDQQGLDPQTPVEAQDQLIHKIQEGDQGDIKSKPLRLRRLKRLSRNWRLLMSKTK